MEQRKNSIKTGIAATVFSLLLLCILPLGAQAALITTHQNWENLEFLPGQTHRIYTPNQFNQAIPDWYVNSTHGNGYGVEHQHSNITWGQAGSNDDFLELDHFFDRYEPQVYTEFSTDNNEFLNYVSVDFDAAGRPDFDASKTLVFYGRIDNGDWQRLDNFSITGGTSQYPNFSQLNFNLSFANMFVESFDFGFACTNCQNTGGYGILLGDVTARYRTRDGATEVPEPASIVLLGAALAGAARKRKKNA